jgi:hypothetical protein
MTWELVGSGMWCPAAVSPRPGHLLLFARGATGELLSREWSDGGWSGIRSLGIPAARIDSAQAVPAEWQIASCSGDSSRIDVFACSPDGDLLHMTGDGATFGPFEFLGSPATTHGGVTYPLGLIGAPAACSARPDRIDVFAIGQTGELLHTWREGSEWSGFESLGVPSMQHAGAQRSMPLSGRLSACRCGTDQMAIAVRGSRGDLMLKWWDGARWSEFASLGWPEEEAEDYPAVTVSAPLSGPPAVCSWGRERLDVFVRGARGQVLHKGWDGRAWSPFVSVGMPVDAQGGLLPSTGAVAACSSGPGRLHVFTRAVDGNVYHAGLDEPVPSARPNAETS